MKWKQYKKIEKTKSWNGKQNKKTEKTIEGKRKEMGKHNNKQNNKNVKNIPLANAARCSTAVRVPTGEHCNLFASGMVLTAGEREAVRQR